jgi:uncharacterized protein (UPF0333 family)
MKASQVIQENEQRIKEASALRSHFIRCSACLKNRIFSNRGQQVMEYALLASAVISALLIMYVYTKRGVQSLIKVSADQIGPQIDSAPLYSAANPENTTSTGSTLTNETTQIDQVGEQRTLSVQSQSASTGSSTTISGERIK